VSSVEATMLNVARFLKERKFVTLNSISIADSCGSIRPE
jgi:hypothetical protein